MKLSFVALLLLAAIPVMAQTFRGGIQGTLTDETGAALPGATVTATHTGTGLSRSAVTDGGGNPFLGGGGPRGAQIAARLRF